MEKHTDSLVDRVDSGFVEKFKTKDEEINFLRNQIANKERELREKNYNIDTEAVVREQISKYKDTLPDNVLEETLKIAENDLDSIVLDLTPETHDTKIKELIKLTNEKGIKNALSVLSQMKDPHLEDDFHKFLVQYVKSEVLNNKKFGNLNTKENEFKGFGMTLFEVVLPENSGEEAQGKSAKTLREMISSMEQFYSGMLYVANNDSENYISLEIANANGSDQFVFYVAVPDSFKDLFEKQIISIFHNAKLTLVKDDYNLFNQEGASVGSVLEASENSIYPIKTYESFDADPMNSVLNSFSKIKREGEGAAIQIIFHPQFHGSTDYFKKKYEWAIEQIEKGVKTKEAINMPETFGGEMKKTLLGLFKNTSNSSSNESGKDGESITKTIDTEAIQKIKNKISSQIVATNIRVVVSAQNKEDSVKILESIESSFNQFTDTSSNGLKWKRLEKSQLQKMLRDFSFRSFEKSELLPLNFKELTTLLHFHTTSLAPTPQLKQTQAVSQPAPANVSNGSNGATLLGINSYRNIDTEVFMQAEDRLRHFYTIGQTGTGKSTLLKNMIIQDIQAGNGVCMIDPHGIDILDVLANIPKDRFQDVIYFDPSFVEKPMALNMLEYDKSKPEQKTFVVNELFSIFQKLYGKVPESMGPMFEQYFRNATMLVIEDPETGSTLLDVSRVMSNKEFRQLKLSRCKNPIVTQFWTEVAEKAGGEAALANIVPYITSKFDVFLANDIMRPIIAQEKSSFNFRDIMDNRKILLVNLSKGRLGDINANLIGLILVGKILMAALSRTDLIGQGEGKFHPFYLYIDEFQNITTNSISTILSEARKYKLSLNIAHQFIAQLDEGIRDAVFGNVGSVCSFRVGSEDAEYLEKQFKPEFSSKDIMNIENRNAILKMLVNGSPTKAFNIKTLPPPKGNPEIIEKLKELSYFTFGGNRREIEEKILAKYKK
jgi:hypothetical protein